MDIISSATSVAIYFEDHDNFTECEMLMYEQACRMLELAFKKSREEIEKLESTQE